MMVTPQQQQTEAQNNVNDDRIRELEATVKRLKEENHRLQQQESYHPLQENVAVESEQSSVTATADEGITARPLLAACPASSALNRNNSAAVGTSGGGGDFDDSSNKQQQLSRDAIERYSRQLLLSDGFGVDGQVKLLASAVLVVGAGGIGSTVLQYLGTVGVGKIGIVDFDTVEMSNLHRQVIHRMKTVGVNKAVSARQAILDLNPTITCEAIPQALTAENALSIIKDYDCIVDASDNPATRYIINDACVLAGGKPLVSGSAVGTQGQLTVYNWKAGAPCYRCLYPKPSAAAVQAGCHACSDAGVLGPVPGLIGILQAMETIKILTNLGNIMHDKLLVYDALTCSFLTIKKPQKRPNCPVCGTNPTIRSMQDSRRNLKEARGPNDNNNNGKNANASSQRSTVSPVSDNILDVTCQEYHRIREQHVPHVLLDVRVERQFEMCALPGAVNIPLEKVKDEMDHLEHLSKNGTKPIYCICRRGVASLQAARIILTEESRRIHSVRNIVGGLTAWQKDVDPSFPKY